MTTEQKELFEKWLEKALHDELAAKSLIKHRPLILDTACFHCQQAVEKYLKGYLVYRNHDFPKIHDLSVLKKMCTKLDKDFNKIDVAELDDYAVSIRYPDDYLMPTLKETKHFLQIVLKIKKLILRKTKLS